MNREDIMPDKKNIKTADAEKKVVTKYDRKVQKRREEQLREARRRFITKWVLIAILAGVIIGSGVAAGLKLNSIYKDYIQVEGDKISEIEFDFYYGISKTNNLNATLYGTMTYGDYYTSYMGYKTSVSDKKQEYSTDYTWYDYFANTTVDAIKETKALLKDADEKGFNYESADADYDEFISQLKDAAGEADMSYKDYIKELYGKRATEKRVSTYIKDYLKSTAYQEHLLDELKATDAEIDEYYQSNKDSYDEFEYRKYTFTSESADSADMEEAKRKADAFAAGVKSELDFINQCRIYSEAGDDTYNDDGASLVTETKKSAIEAACADWIASSDRKEGDVTVIEDSTNTCYYVLYYVKRTYDGDDDETIGSILLDQKYSEYISKYTDDMSVNVEKRFSFE